ncbi:MAG: 6,7-dimethyl-8-ribityllumazine synthase [Alcanivoracaceae bacterium]|nr:6,7-dimethyl-8-ribityllumazine synthase [Alcanivoracaceae bacterium]
MQTIKGELTVNFGTIAIVASEFNDDLVTGLLNGAVEIFKENSIDLNDVKVFKVPGAWEIPIVAKQIAHQKKYVGIIALGVIIKGETAHFEYISENTTRCLQDISLANNLPICLGILTTYTREQAIARSAANTHNKGREAASALLQTINLMQKIL